MNSTELAVAFTLRLNQAIVSALGTLPSYTAATKRAYEDTRSNIVNTGTTKDPCHCRTCFVQLFDIDVCTIQLQHSREAWIRVIRAS